MAKETKEDAELKTNSYEDVQRDTILNFLKKRGEGNAFYVDERKDLSNAKYVSCYLPVP